ncbi:helix-turn-helix domain-containing protein [Sneathiella limimaris]|uniref:helix-turn-helix domain-containing protein n=1 Tax=Sneathiella limimaris TaxID=1964213 RepID=UPI00146DB8F9|nr:helix-turn-helix transcriptional regulator [Sneathiella limimaris]
MKDLTTQKVSDSTITPAERLKMARTHKGYSRKELAAITNIPEKSIEKYEYGSMEPNISRLQTLCEVLEINSESLLGMPESENETTRSESNHTKYFSEALDHIEEINCIRETGFAAEPTKALAHVEALQSALRFLGEDELKKLASAKGISTENMLNLGITELSLRIIDTAIYGVDLYNIEMSALSKLAEHYNLAPSHKIFWIEWENHEEIIHEIRAKFKSEAFYSTNFPNFSDKKLFPRNSEKYTDD